MDSIEADGFDRLVCEPESVTRSEVVSVVMDYLTANTQYASETPIDASYRALVAKWPCREYITAKVPA